MASAGLLALLDDITSLLDDVATMTKVAAKKTAGVVGDDLALNANQVAGTCASRELPVVTAVAKGSLVNKLILIPMALLITATAPSLIKPLLMVGGAFLCFEGAEKVLHRLFVSPAKQSTTPYTVATDPAQLERDRIKGAIVTDSILSAEILVIALGAAAGATFVVQALTLSVIGFGMTLLVYGSVALIVKADDCGVALQRIPGVSLSARCSRAVGRGIIMGAPLLMKTLSILGTAAMFLVGGEILIHGLPSFEHALTSVIDAISAQAPFIPGLVSLICKAILVAGLGLVFGSLLVAVYAGCKRLTSSGGDATVGG
jgi:predicted DNA repair protein MutK